MPVKELVPEIKRRDKSNLSNKQITNKKLENYGNAYLV